MKKLLAVLLASVMAFGMTACGKSDKNETTDAKAPEGKLIMATEAGFAPYEYVEGEEIVGIDVDIAKEIANALGMELVINDMDFTAALLAAQDGSASFAAAGISITEDRLKTMDFTTEYAESKQVILVKAGSEAETAIVDEETMLASKIGAQQGTTADLVYSEEHSDNMSLYKKYAVAADDLKNGKIDCIVMDELPATMLVEKNPELKILDVELFTDKYAFAVQKGNEELLEKLNTELEKLIESGKIEEFTNAHMEKAI